MDFNQINKMKTINPLSGDDLPLITDLLKSFNLPVSDLDTAPIQIFGIKENNNLIAAGALEIYGENAILRSIVVHRNFQGLGLGMHLTRFLETNAKKIGIKNLFLLTTTAESFFKKLNYQFIERDSCPDQIRSSAEFKELCPSTAICLHKPIG